MCPSFSWLRDCAFEVLPMADLCVFGSRFLAAPCMSVHTPDLRHRI